ncbi:Cysteine desulfurase [Thalassoporum mexicanum PCC 7367]|uniref:cysteine desulfurase family protein n=1 Tax=Thalassoporum mexicanum TaxID=3457544 RepID=UPI00029FF8E3|nr:cysteine desulfurase family protein [Pseudanabaena sp. PCC 7367]AFY69233.1 Cysteine desulfurase [Pseudanabaena sp. PCC 7367]
MQVYLDHSATTPPNPEVVRLMQAVMLEQWGNPSSIHAWGERSALVLERARIQVAELLNATPESIVFTSGGTEANNLAVMGIAKKYHAPQHMIISAIEHAAIAEPIAWLEQCGWEITRLAVNSQGWLNPADLQQAIRANTVLVSIIYAQNEVGTIQPIEKLGQICRSAGICFHADAVQAVGRLPIDVQKLPIDMLSISSHKLYGAQGVGALYVRPHTASEFQLLPLLLGGNQESNMRPGTQPIAAIAGFGLAAVIAAEDLDHESARLISLRDRLITQLTNLPGIELTGAQPQSLGGQNNGGDRLPHHASFYHPHLNGRSFVRAMSKVGIGISSGSACSSGSITASPVLLAMGYSQQQALGAIRMTLGRSTSSTQIDYTVQAFKQILREQLPD